VFVTIEEVDLEHYYPNSCEYDTLKLHDGPRVDSRKLATFCDGSMMEIMSSGSSLLVVFESDRGINTGRFSLNWTFEWLGKQVISKI